MSSRKSKAGIEWIGGIVTMPNYVMPEGERPYRPEALFWIGAAGTVLGHAVGKPGELVDAACESLLSTIQKPISGRPHAPDRVRVASPELAEALSEGLPDIEIICAPTPEIDAVFAMLRESMSGDAKPTYLSPDVGPEALAAFFRAGAALYRAEPWKIAPSDINIFSVSIEKLGIIDAAMSVMGQMGQRYGFLIFSGIEDFDRYLDAADAMSRGERSAMPPHFALSFERGADLEAALKKEVAEHGWEIADADAYPWPLALDEDLVARPPTANEMTVAEAIALALPKAIEGKEELMAAFNDGESFDRTIVVATHAGDVEVSFRAPYDRAPVVHELLDQVFENLFELGQDGEEIYAKVRRPLEDEIMRRFAASPEAETLTEVGLSRWLMDFAADYFNATIATLGAEGLREIVFEIIPRKVSIDASAAGEIIEEYRALYAFMKREYGFDRADSCLRVLGGNAAMKLQAALSDSSNFGMAKSLFMGGRDAGFDMKSQEGLDAWMRATQSQSLPVSGRPLSLGFSAEPKDMTAARSKKNARKAARKARRKNR